MKILHVGVGNLGPGGVATYVRRIVEAQRARGHEVFLSEIWPGPQSMPEVQEFLADQPSLVELQDRFLPDITHLHSQLPEYATLRLPSVLTAHDHSAHCPSGGRYLQARGHACERPFGILSCLWGHYVDKCGSRQPRSVAYRFGLTAATPTFQGHWIAPSRYTGEWLGRSDIAPERIHVLGNPHTSVSCGDRARSDTQPLVLFLGRLVPNKGCDILLRAMAALPDESRLRVVGEGPSRRELESLADSLGIRDRVDFRGWQTPEQVREHLSQSRVLSVPSLWPEPFGLVALEAYSAGCPVVASDIGGLKDLVESGRTGELVPPGDPSRLASALLGFLENSSAASTMGRNGELWALARFPLEGHLDGLERIYALASRGSR